MKIAIIVRVLWPGGVQRTAFAEAEGLIKLGNEVDLIFIRKTSRYIYGSSIPYKIIYDEKVNGRFMGRLLKKITLHYSPQRGNDSVVDLDLIRKFEHSNRDKYDIVYYFDEFSAFFSKYSKRKKHHKVVVLIHEVASKDGPFLLRFIQKRALRNADLILTNTNKNLALLKEASYNNCFEVYPGLTPQTDIPSFEKRKNIALSVTMWDFGRKPEVLIEIGKNLNFGKILICGDWTDYNYMNRLKQQIITEGLENKVEITGPITEEVLLNLYKTSKISIRFGYNEKGPGMGSLESIAWGLPLIINNGIGIKEKIVDGKNGVIVNENNAASIARIIEDFFNDSVKWKEMSTNNIQLAKELSWDTHNAKLNELMQGLIKEKGSFKHRF